MKPVAILGYKVDNFRYFTETKNHSYGSFSSQCSLSTKGFLIFLGGPKKTLERKELKWYCDKTNIEKELHFQS